MRNIQTRKLHKLTFLLLLFFLFRCDFPLDLNDKKNQGKLDEIQENLLMMDYLSKTTIEFLELNGNWKDNYGGFHYVYGEKNSIGTSGFWEGVTNPIIVEFDNNAKVLYVKGINEPSWADCNGNGTNGEKGVDCYSRIVWTIYNGEYYYCEIVYNKGSLDDAKNDPATADASNPSSSGCGSFPWTKLTKL